MRLKAKLDIKMLLGSGRQGAKAGEVSGGGQVQSLDRLLDLFLNPFFNPPLQPPNKSYNATITPKAIYLSTQNVFVHSPPP